MSYQMTGPEDDPTYPWDYLKFGLGAMAPDNAGPFLRDNLGLGLSSPAPAPAPAPVQDGMAGWASPPDQGGLGVRGQSDAAPAGSGMNWVDALKGIGGALEGFSAGFHGRTPLFVKMQELDQQQQMHRDTLAQQQQARRDAINHQIEQLEEQKRKHAWDQNFGIATNPQLSPSQRMQFFKDRAKTDPIAAQFWQGLNEKMIGEFQSVAPYMPHPVEHYQKGLVSGAINFDTVASDMEVAKETRKMVMDAQKPALQLQALQRLMQQNPNDPAYAQALATLQAEMQTKQDEAKIKKVTSNYAQPRAEADIAHTKSQTALNRAPREMYSGISGPGGESVTGIYYPATEKLTELRGTPIQRTQDMNAAQIKDTVEERAALTQIRDLEKNYDDEYVGTIDNMIAKIRETAPGVFGSLKEKEAKFRKQHNQIITSARRIDAGTAQSTAELIQLANTYPDLGQHESVYKPALEAMRERVRSKLEARNRLAAEIRAGKQQPTSLSERAAQLSILVSTPGFAKDSDDAKAIAQQILREEMKLGIVKAD